MKDSVNNRWYYIAKALGILTRDAIIKVKNQLSNFNKILRRQPLKNVVVKLLKIDPPFKMLQQFHLLISLLFKCHISYHVVVPVNILYCTFYFLRLQNGFNVASERQNLPALLPCTLSPPHFPIHIICILVQFIRRIQKYH